ncbi:MAG: DUF4124 domain-containing protein, partial [Pseudomonadota bacterium]
MRTVTFTTSILILLLHSVTAGADIYKYVAPDGRVYYSDEPRHSQYELIIRTPARARHRTHSASKSAGLNVKKSRFTPLIESVAE